MTAADLTALLAADLNDADNRGILNDALLDAGYDVDLAVVWQIGYDDAFDQSTESGSADEPDGGWDSWLINGVGFVGAAEVFGLSKSDRGSEAWAACCKVYHLGACDGAQDAAGQSDGE